MAQRSLRPTPDVDDLQRRLDPRVVTIAARVRGAGGRALLVGGFVRDLRLGIDSKDVDLEVFGIDPETLSEILSG
ncbi:MAG TPA: hypothetical protein VKA86_15775, partial [Candidatus Krumholzibacteria bacterium]|nr:hypothetical protein [Candidatus Krumholzibacteria bacterium]